MAGGVGNLTVGVGVDLAEFVNGLTKAQREAEIRAKAISNAFSSIATAIGAYVSLDAFKSLITGAIDAADHLNDLSKKTGVAVETLGGIGFAASQAGGDLESATAAAGKLNKSLAEAAAGNKEAAEAFRVLGISVKDTAGNTKTADVALAEIADKFASYADGPEKAALALRLFSKAGADIIPLLDDGGKALQENIAYFKRYSGVTAETAKAADEFNDTLGKVNLLSRAFGTTLAADLLPTLKTVADAFLAAKESGDQFSGVAGTIASVFKGLVIAGAYVIDTFGGVGREIGAIAAQMNALAHLDLKGFTAIGDAVKADGVRAKNELDAFVNKVLNPALASAGQGAATTGAKPSAPGLAKIATGPTDDPTKKLLENQLKQQEAAIAAERDLLQTRNRFLDLYNSQSLLSIKDYYAGRKNAQDEATKAEVEGYTREIALLLEFQGKASTSQVNRADAEGKITDLVAKRTKVEQQAGTNAIEMAVREKLAQDDLIKSLASVNAQVLDLGENFAAAAAIKFDLQFDGLSKTFTANGNQAGLHAIATLRAATVAQAAFQKASLDAGRTLDDLSKQEDRIAIAQQTGALTTLEGLAKVGEARRAQIPLIEAQVAANEAIARASGDTTLIKNAEAARLSLDKLKAASDPLAESLNKTFGGDFNSALDDFVTGTKTAADAFKSMAKSILNDILKMGSKSITESIFGGSGGAGGLLSGLFSSGSAQGGVSAGGSLLSSLGSLFSGFFADGGTIAPGKWGVVGENGPELAFGGATGKSIAPMGGGNTQHINVNVQASPGMNHETALQQGASIGQGIQRALARNA